MTIKVGDWVKRKDKTIHGIAVTRVEEVLSVHYDGSVETTGLWDLPIAEILEVRPAPQEAAHE